MFFMFLLRISGAVAIIRLSAEEKGEKS